MKKTKYHINKKVLSIFKRPITYIIVICLLIQLGIYKTIPDYILTSDSHTYSEEYQVSIFKGEVDKLRTPVYPYLIKIINKIGGNENLNNNIVIFQKILFILTLVMFYYCLKKITNKEIISSCLTIIFGICPYIIFWNIMVLTEAISLFEIVFISLLTIQYIKKPKKYLSVLVRHNSINNGFYKTSVYIYGTNICAFLDYEIYT